MTDKNEAVVHPAHYGGGDNPYEAIKVIEAAGLGEGFCLGNTLKYLLRAGKKDPVIEACHIHLDEWGKGDRSMGLSERVLVACSGDTSDGWKREAEDHDAFMRADDRGGGTVPCEDCGAVLAWSGTYEQMTTGPTTMVCPRCQDQRKIVKLEAELGEVSEELQRAYDQRDGAEAKLSDAKREADDHFDANRTESRDHDERIATMRAKHKERLDKLHVHTQAIASRYAWLNRCASWEGLCTPIEKRCRGVCPIHDYMTAYHDAIPKDNSQPKTNRS